MVARPTGVEGRGAEEGVEEGIFFKWVETLGGIHPLRKRFLF